MKYESCKLRLFVTVKFLVGMWLLCCSIFLCYVYVFGVLLLFMIIEKSNLWVFKSVVLCLIVFWVF